MRRFDAEYLTDTRRGMWEDSREALAPLELSSRERVLDVGCGTGELTRVLRAETDAEVIGVDADRSLLDHADPPVVAGDACRLPFDDGAFDLLVCQALLINLPDPTRALEEFARVASDRVAVIEPDNGAVAIDSTVPAEADLAGRARERYLAGVDTDVTLGADARSLFPEAGLRPVATRRYDHVRTIEPPYSASDLEAARRKASGEGLADDRATMLSGDLSPAEYDRLRERWREMGRTVIEQMRTEEYERTETVPFYVTVGDV